MPRNQVCAVLGCTCDTSCLTAVTILAQSKNYAHVYCVYSAECTAEHAKRFAYATRRIQCTPVRLFPSVEENVDLMKHVSYCHVMNAERSTTIQLKILLTIWHRIHATSTQRRYPPKVCVTGTPSTEVVREALNGHWISGRIWASVIG